MSKSNERKSLSLGVMDEYLNIPFNNMKVSSTKSTNLRMRDSGAFSNEPIGVGGEQSRLINSETRTIGYDYDDLIESNTIANNNLSKIGHENFALSQQNVALTLDLSRLEEKFKATVATLERDGTTIETLSQTNNFLQEQIEKKDDENGRLKETNKDLQNQYLDYVKKYETKSTVLRENKTLLETEKQRTSDLEVEISEKNQHIMNLNMKKEEAEKFQLEIRQLKIQKNKLIGDSELLNVKHSNLEKNLENSEKSLLFQNAENEKCRSYITELQNRYDVVVKENNNLQKCVSEMNDGHCQEISAYNVSLNNSFIEAETLKQEIRSLKIEHNKMISENASAQNCRWKVDVQEAISKMEQENRKSSHKIKYLLQENELIINAIKKIEREKAKESYGHTMKAPILPLSASFMDVDGLRDGICEMCDRAFATANGLSIHESKMHSYLKELRVLRRNLDYLNLA